MRTGVYVLAAGLLATFSVPGACGRSCGGGGGSDGGSPGADAGASDGRVSTDDEGFPDGGWITPEWRKSREAFLSALDGGATDVSDGLYSVHRELAGGSLVREDWSIGGNVALSYTFDGRTVVTNLREEDGDRLTRRIEESRDAGGSIDRRTTTFGAVGTPDTRESYSWSPGQATLETLLEEDADHDGGFIPTGTETRPAVDFNVVLEVNGKFPACDGALPGLLDAAVAANDRCFSKLLPKKGAAIRAALDGSGTTVTIRCKPLSGAAAQHNPDDSIDVNPGAIGDPDLAPTLFHELLHLSSVFGSHRNGSGLSDPADQVWGCEWACFGKGGAKPTSIECAQCRGTLNGDPRCGPKRYPHKDCGDLIYCCADGQAYTRDQETQCVHDCNPGLKLCQPICGPWAPSGPCRQPSP